MLRRWFIPSDTNIFCHLILIYSIWRHYTPVYQHDFLFVVVSCCTSSSLIYFWFDIDWHSSDLERMSCRSARWWRNAHKKSKTTLIKLLFDYFIPWYQSCIVFFFIAHNISYYSCGTKFCFYFGVQSNLLFCNQIYFC